MLPIKSTISIYAARFPELPPSASNIRLKIDRANKHIGDLKMALDSFYAKRPYRASTKNDPSTGEEILYVTRVDSIPPDIPAIVGDAIQNLRSALDHLAVKLYMIKNPTNGKDIVYFPVAQSAASYNSTGFRGQIKPFGIDIEERFDKVQPYKGGCDLVWKLHELNKIDKHRLIISAISAAQIRTMLKEERERFSAAFGSLVDKSIFDIIEWTDSGITTGRLKVGDILRRGRPLSPEEKKQMQVRIDVTFDEPGICENESVLNTLYLMSRVVENICRSFADLL